MGDVMWVRRVTPATFCQPRSAIVATFAVGCRGGKRQIYRIRYMYRDACLRTGRENTTKVKTQRDKETEGKSEKKTETVRVRQR